MGILAASTGSERRSQGRETHEFERCGLHRRGIRAPDAQGGRQVGHAAACRMRQGRAGGCRPDQGRRRRLLLRRRRAGPRPAVDGRLHEPEMPPRGQHRCRRFVVPGRGRPCAGIDRRRTLQHRADHAGRPPAQRGPGHRHRAARRQPRAAGDAVRISLWSGHREHVRDVRHAPHARIRHDQRAARLDQGRRVASRAAQPACHAARRRDGRGRGEVADGGDTAASAGLLRDQRRRRRADRHQAGDRQEPEAADGESHRRR